MAEHVKPAKTKKRKPKNAKPTKEFEFERTLAIIKPDGILQMRYIDAVIDKEGLFVLHKKRINLKREQAVEFFVRPLEDETEKMYLKLYEDLKQNRLTQVSKEETSIKVPPIFKAEEEADRYKEDLVDYLTSGPVEILVLAGRGAVDKWQELAGPPDPSVARQTHPNSIRARYGHSEMRNVVYGSESQSGAEREIRFWFPDSRFEAEFRLGAAGEYLSQTVNPVLLKGLIQLCRQKPDNPLVWLADWLLANNPNAKLYL